jgi:adenylyltransferase/sulfurtransferase
MVLSRLSRYILLLFLFTLATVAISFAASSDDVARVSTMELKEMIDSGQPLIIVDNRPGNDYNLQRIKGAISLPWAMDVTATAKKILPQGKLIITYCACGPGESDSADVAAQLLNSGFKNVKTLKDGWEAWEAAKYPVEKGKRK